MSLSTALGIAQSTLLNTSRQTTVVSRNISEGSNPDYSRRSAMLVTTAYGAQVVEIRRATNDVLSRQNLAATTAAAGQGRILEGLNALNIDVYGVEYSTSPAKVIGEFQAALQIYGAAPSNLGVAERAVDAARTVVRVLNNGTDAIQSFRSDLDREIAGAVGELNRLLADFETANREIVAGSQLGRDVTEALDQRDGLLKKISELVPVSAIKRADNDLMLITASGVTLFETQPRGVSFAPVPGYGPTIDGNAIHIDGVPIDADAGASGTLAAMLHLRDDVASGMQAQLDEIARGLITALAERDTTDPLPQPDRAGLFSWSSAPVTGDIPAANTRVVGLAGMIMINPAFADNPHLIRDGQNGAPFEHNSTGGASWSELILGYADRLEAPMSFDATAGLDAGLSVVAYSTESVSWFEAQRHASSRAAESQSALVMHTREALSNATGVNIDEELTLLLDLEHTYEASARLLRVVDDMLTALMNAVR